jgi:hypothetical protein
MPVETMPMESNMASMAHLLHHRVVDIDGWPR